MVWPRRRSGHLLAIRPLVLTRIFGAILLVAVAAMWVWRDYLRFGVDLPTRDNLELWIDAAGVWGPFMIVGLMALAIVASPLPSAPIAIAAGAAYGHILGTVLVVLGAELGAVAAFVIARGLGRPFVERYLGQQLGTGFLGSQNTLTFIVFVSRLLPFLSFDMISYAAGLSPIRLWRFALATLAGIIPTSFLLAHVGETAVRGDARTAAWTTAVLGGFTFATLLFAFLRQKLKPKAADERSDSPLGRQLPDP